MRLIVLLVIMLCGIGCSSMLLGSSGQSAGAPIGTDRRSSAQVSSDDRISTAVRSRFAADQKLRARGLRVDTRGGVVTLRGVLTSFPQRDRAVRIATDVEGAIRVDNQLSVDIR